MQLNIIGQILGCSGYDSHTRQMANALSKIVDVRLQTNVPNGTQTQLTDKELEMIKKPNKEEINLIITHPLYWKPNLTAKRNWVYCVWEGDKVPDYFIEEMLNEDIEYIIVPSKHTKEAIENTDSIKPIQSISWKDDLMEKIKVIPHGVDLNKFYPKEKKTPNFTFFCNKGFRNLEDRGGVQYLIKAFIEEFKLGEAELNIKINPSYGVLDINKIFDLKKAPVIRINPHNIPYEELVGLYNECDVYVSPTRAEAFNLGCIEAMACGKPVITTNFGGQTDYCTNKTGWLIGGELKEVKHELEYEGIKWLTPSIKELRAKMREAFESRDFQSKIECAEETSRKFTWDNSAQEMKGLI